MYVGKVKKHYGIRFGAKQSVVMGKA